MKGSSLTSVAKAVIMVKYLVRWTVIYRKMRLRIYIRYSNAITSIVGSYLTAGVGG